MYIATFFVAFISSVLSGIAGGGGSFLMAPYWLIAGLSPVQGATTGAFMAIGMGGSSLVAFKGTDHMPKNDTLVWGLFIMTLLTSLVGPFFLAHISITVFKPILAILTIVSLPFLFINRTSVKLTIKNKTIGLISIALLFLVSSFITSSAFSIIIAVLLTRVFGLTVLQSTALRRFTGLVQSLVIFTVLVLFGGFVWQYAIAALFGGSIGSYVGTRVAIRSGEKFARNALAVGALVSSVALLL